jgi:hypothetical protein
MRDVGAEVERMHSPETGSLKILSEDSDTAMSGHAMTLAWIDKDDSLALKGRHNTLLYITYCYTQCMHCSVR